jgi:NUMOD3 motif
MAECYVYVYFRLNGVPCYVGKGSGNRYRHRGPTKRNPHFAAIMAASSNKLPVVVVRRGLSDDEAFTCEEALIAAIGRECDGGPLINLGKGGKGGSTGVKMSPAWRARRSLKSKEMWANPEIRARLSATKIGNQYKLGKPNSALWRARTSERMKGNTNTLGMKLTAEQREKISVAHRGRKQSAEWIEKRTAPLRGREVSEETRAKLSFVNIGRKVSDEVRAKMSARLKGKRFSPETIAKRIATLTARTQSPKAIAERAAKHAAKLAAARKGNPLPSSQVAKISAALKGRPWSEARRMAANREARL